MRSRHHGTFPEHLSVPILGSSPWMAPGGTSPGTLTVPPTDARQGTETPGGLPGGGGGAGLCSSQTEGSGEGPQAPGPHEHRRAHCESYGPFEGL